MLGTCSWTKIKGEEGRAAKAGLEEQSGAFSVPFRNRLAGIAKEWVGKREEERSSEGSGLMGGAG